jgi:DNA-binding transcriptional ArsR family regulator
MTAMENGVARRFGPDVYQMQAEIAKVLANPVRLRIVHRIGAGEVPYGQLLAELGISKTNLSQHLGVLRRGGLVTDRRHAGRMYFRLTYPEITDLCAAMRDILVKHLSENGRQGRILLRRVM